MDINNETHPMTNRESFWQAITLACQDLKDQAPQATAHIIHREYMQQDHRE